MDKKFPGFVFQVVWDTLAVTIVSIVVSCIKFHRSMKQRNKGMKSAIDDGFFYVNS